MGEGKTIGGPMWLHWARTAVVFTLFAEYARLVLTTDVAPYRVVVMGGLAVLFGASLIILLRARRRRAGVRRLPPR